MLRYGVVGLVMSVGAAAVVLAGGQEAVTLKITKPKAGDRIRVTKTEKMKSSVTFGAGGKSFSKDDDVTKTIVYVDEVVTAGEPRPAKLKRTYEKYDVTGGNKNEPTPPLNTAITIEKTGGKYTFTTDGKPVEGPFASKLSAEFDKGSSGGPKPGDILPDKPVKPGDTWKIDGAKLASFAGDGKTAIDPDKSSISGKLLKTYQKDGKQFGVIELTGEIVIKELGEKSPVKIKPGSKMGVKATIDACVDGTDPSLKMDGVMTVRLEGEGGGATLSISGDGTMTETQELLKK